MLAIVLAVLLGADPLAGTVFTADGGRIRGTVLDTGAGGVTVQLADGSTRKLEAAQVARVDFADGTSWKPAAPGAAMAPAAAPAAAAVAQPAAPAGQAAAAGPQAQAGTPPGGVVPLAAAAPPAASSRATPLLIPVERLDTVYLARGGRVRCLVVEEGTDGVVVRLMDGAERRYPPGQVARIDWADGTRSDLSGPPPAPVPTPAAQAR